jgi:hypothetical protein
MYLAEVLSTRKNSGMAKKIAKFAMKFCYLFCLVATKG